jgi:prepilin-type N-terminal cleavage/methylation domain-containing protein
MHRRPPSSGFTLIEMSVVLVIIGLLVGGVIAGTALLRSSRIQSVLTDVQNFTNAISSFRDKYAALPGDMPNATSYWGVNPNCAANGAGTGTQTCNGNGNSMMASLPNAEYGEQFLLFQHLANAGLIQGSYTGVTGSVSSNNPVIGGNVPASKVKGAGYAIFFMGIYSDSNTFSSDYAHALRFAGSDPSSGILDEGAITPLEASQLDAKIDDGLPGSGTVMGPTMSAVGASGCTTSNTAASAAYSTASTSLICSLLFKLGL